MEAEFPSSIQMHIVAAHTDQFNWMLLWLLLWLLPGKVVLASNMHERERERETESRDKCYAWVIGVNWQLLGHTLMVMDGTTLKYKIVNWVVDSVLNVFVLLHYSVRY